MNINIGMGDHTSLYSGDKSDLLIGLDDYQYAAVVYNNDKNLLCNAIAGSGKTHVLTTKVAWLIANGIDPTNIMLLTFTNKAAKEMIERVSAKFDNRPIGVKAGTFHSIASKYLRQYSYVIGFDRYFTILDQKESRELISQIRKTYLEESGFSKAKIKEFIKASAIQNIYTKMINLQVDMYDMNIPSAQIVHIENILAEYNRIKIEAELMDFDDLLVYFDKILDNEDVRNNIQNEISHVLIDEYQDINHIQDSIIKKISNKERVFAVGDPSQSIYAFRGSDIRYIEEFTEEYGAEEINLKNNYRSDKNILMLAQNAINKNPQRNIVEMKAYRDTDYQQNFNEYYHIGEEISATVNQIKELINKGVDKSEIAVLIRSTGQNVFMLEAAIRKAKIPYELRAGFSYFDKAHIKDIISMLILIVNPKCIVSFYRAMSLIDGVGEKTADKIYEFYVKNEYSFENCIAEKDNIPGSKKAKEGFLELAETIVDAKEKEFVKDIIVRVTAGYYMEYLKKKYGNEDDYKDRVEDVLDFPNITEATTLIDFLEDIALDSESISGEDNNEDRIVISTMHRSKGLEWDYVFIPFLFIGNFPQKISDQKEVEEERRLFYVSLTRARKTLYLSTSKYNINYDFLSKSIFLNDMLS